MTVRWLRLLLGRADAKAQVWALHEGGAFEVIDARLVGDSVWLVLDQEREDVSGPET